MRRTALVILSLTLLLTCAWVIGGPFIALHSVLVAFQTVGIFQTIVVGLAVVWLLLAIVAQWLQPQRRQGLLAWAFLVLFVIGGIFYGLSVYEFYPSNPHVWPSILEMWGFPLVGARTIFVWSMYITVLSGACGCLSSLIGVWTGYRNWRARRLVAA
ncbi:MAG: hypothetical protein ACRCWS_04130 [Propionibacteriaceae bacterium]